MTCLLSDCFVFCRAVIWTHLRSILGPAGIKLDDRHLRTLDTLHIGHTERVANHGDDGMLCLGRVMPHEAQTKAVSSALHLQHYKHVLETGQGTLQIETSRRHCARHVRKSTRLTRDSRRSRAPLSVPCCLALASLRAIPAQ